MKRSSAVLLLLVLLDLTACMSFVNGWGGISPAQFEFEPIVPWRAPGPGGWKGARLVIQLVHVTESGVKRNVLCPIEVQVPERNFLGAVDDELARVEAAKAADAAAERVLTQSGLFSAEMCRRFEKEMEVVLGAPIPGARVVKAL